MLEKRKVYIDQLLRDLKALEERVSAIKDSDSLPFSFFRESFDKTQEISRTLHQLEFMQIDDMRREMERLVHFLSGVESREHRQAPPPTEVPPVPQTAPAETPEAPEPAAEEAPPVHQPAPKDVQPALGATPEEASPAPQPATEEAPKTPQPAPKSEQPAPEPVEETPSVPNEESKAFALPEYRNPKIQEYEKPASRATLNDAIPSQPVMVDLKRGFSLNDRFLFQRELFQNNKRDMDQTMVEMGKLSSYEEAEQYLRESRQWDFESPTVNDFLLVIKQGFE